MKAYQILHYKKPAEFEDITEPGVGSEEIQVKIKASGLNPVDYKIQAGKMRMLDDTKLPLTMGNEFSGVVTKTGKNVDKFSVGDEVYARPDMKHTGTLTKYISLNQDEVALKPNKLDFASASGIPLTGLTSFQVLVEQGKIEKGQKVFIQGGSGGIGTLAIQIAKAYGAFVATTASAENADLVRSLGADQVIDYKKTYFADALNDYDLAFDTLGGQFLKDSFKIVKPGGKVITINGAPTYQFGREHGYGMAKSLLFKLISQPIVHLAKKYHVNYEFYLMHPSGTQLQILSNLVEKGELRPVVNKIFTFDNTPEAYDYLKNGHPTGKVIVENKTNKSL